MRAGRGVTLVEVMIVMITIAILSIAIFLSLQGAIEEAHEADTSAFRGEMNALLGRWFVRRVTSAEPAGGWDFMPGGAVRSACFGTPAETLGWSDWLTLGGEPLLINPLPEDTARVSILIPLDGTGARCVPRRVP